MSSLARSDALTFEGYYPGFIGACIELHMAYYTPAWDFGRQFEVGLASGMGAFFEGYDPSRDLVCAVKDANGRLVASIVLDVHGEADHAGHLRWFVTHDDVRGQGLGKQLMGRVMSHARSQGLRSMYLTTFSGLTAARHLYENAGFRLAQTLEEDPWSGTVGFQRFDWHAQSADATLST